jgi:hypothetical protein
VAARVDGQRRRSALTATALASAATLLLLATATATAGVGEAPRVDAAPPQHAPAQPAPAQLAPAARRVVLVSDSVGLGAAGALPAAFGAGWDVNVIGTPAHFVEMLETQHVRPQLAANPQMFGDHVVVAGGYNYPYWDPARFDRSIDSMISTLVAAGVDHVYWVTVREVKPQFVTAGAWRDVQPYAWYFPTVNDHLERALDRHPSLRLIDWAAAADRPGITYDAIHLNPTGAALYSSLVAQAVSDASKQPPNGGVTRVRAPDGAAAVALNLTSTASRAPSYLTAYPCESELPVVSNANPRRNQTVAAASIVPVGPSGEICIYNRQAGHVIVDLFGTFTDDAAAYTSSPVRLLDTRGAPAPPHWRSHAVRVSAPAGAAGHAEAVAINVTAVDAPGDGYVSVHPCSVTDPTTSTVNFTAGAAVPNLAVVAPDDDGNVCVSSSAPTHVLVDRFASFGVATASTPMRLTSPTRVVDTRRDPAPPVDGQVVRFSIGDGGLAAADLGPGGTGGVLANLTIADPRGWGYATVFPCADGRPDTSNVNYVAGTNVANMVTVRPDADGEICVFTYAAAEVIVDVAGATGDGFVGLEPSRLADTRR